MIIRILNLKLMSITALSPKPRIPNFSQNLGPSKMEIHSYGRKKKLKILESNTVEDERNKIGSPKNEGLPDIEEFAYKKAKKSVDSSSCPSIEASLSSGCSLVIGKEDNLSNSTKAFPPENWVEILAGIKKMRSSITAPVDSIGCDRAHSSLPPKERRFAVLASTLLSSQTKDAVTHGAVLRLTEKGLLSAETIVQTEETVIANLLYPVGFYKRKAQYMKKVAEICLDKYGGDIPETLNGLLSLPGIGPKIAHLVMQIGWNNVQGICVDTHVHRICNRLGWVTKPGTNQKTSNPEATRVSLETWLPKDEWVPINLLLVGFGQTVCTPLRPRCSDCSLNHLCPSAFKEASSPISKSKRSVSMKKI